MRAVIYARSIRDKQREASTADQIEIGRRYVERQGWMLTGTCDDVAISGASRRRRPGSQRLLAAADARRFDVVVCEAIDRAGPAPSASSRRATMRPGRSSAGRPSGPSRTIGSRWR
ncbi:MAG: recombinase family protein [Rhodospirillales bacterium]|nr:recombinase family protein [Rhodospirillales bacterium]